MASVRSGFHAAKFHGNVAIAEWPMGMIGVNGISEYPDSSPSAFSKAPNFRSVTSLFVVFCQVSNVGAIRISPMPNSVSVRRKDASSRMPSSSRLYCPATTARTRWQLGGIHRKARGCSLESGKVMEFTGTDHCHTAAAAVEHNPHHHETTRILAKSLSIDSILSRPRPVRHFAAATHISRYARQALGGRLPVVGANTQVALFGLASFVPAPPRLNRAGFVRTAPRRRPGEC